MGTDFLGFCLMPYRNVFARRLIARLSGKEGICRRPSGFPQDFLCAEEHGESSSEYVKVVRQSVQEHERIGRDGVLRGSATGLAFGPAADGTADVGLRYDDVSARQGEPLYRRQDGADFVDSFFEKSDVSAVEVFYLIFAAMPKGHQRFGVHQQSRYDNQVVVELCNVLTVQHVPEHGRLGGEFVDGTVGLHPDVVFRDAFSADEGGTPLVAAFGVYFHRFRVLCVHCSGRRNRKER